MIKRESGKKPRSKDLENRNEKFIIKTKLIKDKRYRTRVNSTYLKADDRKLKIAFLFST